MGFDPVPWFVEGGAQHSAQVARTMAWYCTGGMEGVATATDLRVLALSTPGTRVRVMPGACCILNRALGGESESYVGKMRTQDDTIEIPASGAGGPRTHLIVARVENPNISGEPWAAAPDVEDGPYIYPRVIPDVPIGIRSVHELGLAYSAITLGRVVVPASTATITQAMLTDLRTVANPLTGMQPPPGEGGDNDGGDDGPIIVIPGPDGDNDGDNPGGDPLESTATTMINWPFNAVWNLTIPAWANTMDITAEIQNVQTFGGTVLGLIRLLIAGIAQAAKPFAANNPSGDYGRTTIPLNYPNLPVPQAIRGTTQVVRLQSQVTQAISAAKVIATKSTTVKVAVKFKQQPALSA